MAEFEGGELDSAVKFWILAVVGLIGCIWIGRLIGSASPSVAIIFASMAVVILTMYSPKAGLGLIVFAMLLSPEIQLGGFSAATSGGARAIVVRFDDLLIIVVFMTWLGRTALVKGLAVFQPTPVHLPIFLYTSCCVVATILSVLRGEISWIKSSFYVLKYIEYFLLYFMSVNIIENERDVKQFLVCFFLTAFVVVIYGYFGFLVMGQTRTTAPFEAPWGQPQLAEPASLGGYLIIVLAMLIGLYSQTSGFISTLAIVGAAFTLPNFLLTLSRSSYAGMFALLLLVLYHVPRKRLQLGFSIGGLILALMFFLPDVADSVMGRVQYTFTGRGYYRNYQTPLSEVSLGVGSIRLESSAAQRVYSWQRIISEKFPKHPILGWGVTGVGLVDAQLPLVLGEVGAVGLIFFVWMLWRISILGWLSYKRPDALEIEKALGFALFLSMVALVIQSIGTNTFIIVRIMEPFWFLTALVSRYHLQHQSQGDG